jgi:hypothetical protein
VVWRAKAEGAETAEEAMRRVARAASDAKTTFAELAKVAGATDRELEKVGQAARNNPLLDEFMGLGGGGTQVPGGGVVSGGGGGGRFVPPNPHGGFRPMGVPRGTKREVEEAKWGFSDQFRPMGVPRGTKREVPEGAPSITRAATPLELAQVFDDKTAKRLNTSLKDLVEHSRGIERDAGRTRNSWRQYSIGMAYAARHAVGGGIAQTAGMAAGVGVALGAGFGPAGAYAGSIIGQTAGEAASSMYGSAMSAAALANPAGQARLEQAQNDLKATWGRSFTWLQRVETDVTRVLADAMSGIPGGSVGAAASPTLGRTFANTRDYAHFTTQSLLSQTPGSWFQGGQSGWGGTAKDVFTYPFRTELAIGQWLWGLARPSQPGVAN